MFRLVEPASGRVIIDKQNTDQMGLHDLREELTIIPQEPVLFRLGCSQKTRNIYDQIFKTTKLQFKHPLSKVLREIRELEKVFEGLTCR